MKKQIIAFAVASVVAVPASAQSNMAVYGIADIGLARISNKSGSAVTEVRSGNLQTSRLGFRGNEDLGGGLSAIFQLESGIKLDDGMSSSATVLWNRQSWVGLSSKQYGKITVGLQTRPSYDFFVPLSNLLQFGPSGAALEGAAPAGTSASRFGSGSRFSNSIKFTSADMSGFKINAMMSLGEVQGSNSAGTMSVVGLNYKRGPIDAGLSYQVTNCKEASGCAGNRGDDKLIEMGGGYNFGPATLGAVYGRQENAKNVRGNDADMISSIIIIPLQAWAISAGYQVVNDKTVLNQDVKQVNFGIKYFLSKRTALYGIYSKQKVDNGGKAGVLVLSSNDRQNQVSLGVRHNF